MGTPKPRVLGSRATIKIGEIKIGEIEKFGAKNLNELKKSQPLGDKTVTSQVIFKGWDLNFEGGKVDWDLAQMIHLQDKQITSGGRSPLFEVTQEILYYNKTIECWTYPEVSIHGYEVNIPMEEITEKFDGFCGKPRVASSVDTTTVDSKTSIARYLKDNSKDYTVL